MDMLLALWLHLFGSKVQTIHQTSTKFENATQAIVREFKEDAPVALAICQAESGLNSKAISSTGDYGTCQINLKAHYSQIPGATKEAKIAWLQNFQNNVRFSKYLKDTSGFHPWTTYTSGSYKKYLKAFKIGK